LCPSWIRLDRVNIREQGREGVTREEGGREVVREGGSREGGHFLDLYGWLPGLLKILADSGLSPKSA